MSTRIIIAGGTVVDGTGRDPVVDGAVVVEDGRILLVGRDPGRRDGAREIDAGGATILPGLVDLHTHFCGLRFEDRPLGLTPATITNSLLAGIENARRCIESGVTTARDTGSGAHVFAFKQAVAAGRIVGPRLVVSGNPICMTGGHGHTGGAQEADGPDEVMKAARQQLKAGADWLKLMATAGAASVNARLEDTQLTVEEMAAACHEAHKRGRRVCAHVANAQGARNCLAAGVDCIEHGLALDEAIVAEMARRGVAYDPTLWIYRDLVERGPGPGIGRNPRAIGQVEPLLQAHDESFRMAIAAGVKVGAGTDTGASYSPMGVLPLELACMVRAGQTVMGAIESATRVSAEILELADELGTLEPGKLADLILVDGDPLTDVRALTRTRLTMKEGRVLHDRAG